MPRAGLTVAEIMAILQATPGRIVELTAGLGEAELRTAPALGEWSVGDLLAHLRASHDVLGGSMLRILAKDRPAWRRVSPRARMRTTDYVDWAFAPALDAFTRQRTELLAVLRAQPLEAWQRYAIVTDAPGTIRNRTVQFYGDWMAAHEREHLDQIQATVSAVRRA